MDCGLVPVSDCDLLYLLPLELAHVQTMIKPAPIQKLLMRALFDNLSVVDDDDVVRIADGAQSVRDHKRSPPLHQAQQRFLDARFGARVNTAGGFIQNQNAGIGENGARDCQKLALPLTEIARTL